MSIKRYLKNQWQIKKLYLEHDDISDFYLSSFQRSRSKVPLLLLRCVIFVGSLSILIASMVLTSRSLPFKYWPIYLTHWGLVMNAIAAGFGFAVSVIAFIKGSFDDSQDLQWYHKVYWGMFNMATPIALFITVFYWLLLTGVEQEFAINFTLDVFIHAVNSILMLALLLCAGHPARLLHFYFAIGIAVVYLIFTIIYYCAGGTDAFGNYTIYPMVDWSAPGKTVGLMLLSAFGIILLHGLVVAISNGRDALSRRFEKEPNTYNTDEAYY